MPEKIKTEIIKHGCEVILLKETKKRNLIITFIIVFIIAAVASLLVIITLSVHKNQKKPDENISVKDITFTVIQKMNYQNLSEISSENISKYYDIPEGVVSESDMYVPSRSDSFTEIACFKLTDVSRQDELLKATSEYTASKINTYKNISEKENQNIVNSKTQVNYPYVFVVISNDCDMAISTFNSITDPKTQKN